MNNWRLLLLAVVAVFQPIVSFADNNLIDGRQQCCDRLSSAPLQDTRSSLHGTTRLRKTTFGLQRLSDGDETREDRRYEVRQRVSIYSRPSTERPLVDIRARVARQASSEIARSSRVAHRQERPANSQSRERLLDVHQRKETVRLIQDLKPQDLTRRVVDRSRDALERRNDRVYTESPRDRDDYRTERFGNGRLSKNLFDSQRETQRERFSSVERRVTLNGDARRVLSQTQDNDVPSIEGNHINNRQRIARERLSEVRRVSTIRPDTRRNSDRNNERRDLQKTNEQRLSLTGNTRLVDRDMHVRHTAREDNRENQQRILNYQRLSNERFDERREQAEERRESRQRNKENIDHSTSVERMQLDRRITRESRMMIAQKRNVDGRREARVTPEIRDETREKPDQRLSRERILMDRRNIRESKIMNARNKREFGSAREIRFNERKTRETQDEKTKNLEQRLSRERIQMDRRNTRESRTMNIQNTRNVADRRENRINERQTRDENRENLEQRLSRDRIHMDRKNIHESRIMKDQNIRNVADRRDLRNKEKATRETSEEIRENLEQRLSRGRTQTDRKNIPESRTMNSRNIRNVADRRENSINGRMTREAQDENRENPKQRLSRGTIEMDRRNTRESKMINGQNTRNVADRREIRHKERTTREIRDKNREDPEQRLSHDRTQMDRRDVHESRMMNTQNTRDVAVRREIRNSERISRNARAEREHHINRPSVERPQLDRSNFREFRVIQIERRNIRELSRRTVNTPSDKDIDSQREIRYSERSAEISKEASRINPEQRISHERIQMNQRNVREFRNRNIVIRADRDVENRKEIRNDARLDTENRGNPDNRLSRERIQMHRRNIRESRIGNTVHIRDLDSRQEIRLARESREELRENPDRRLARESWQVDGQNIRESRVNRVATRNARGVETDSEKRLGIRNNERLSGQIHGDQITRERRVQPKSADRVNAEDRDSSMMNRRARSVERRNFREIRAETHRLNRSADLNRRSEVFRSHVEHTHRIENRESEAIDARSRNVAMARNREKSSVMVGKMETENLTVATWQYVLYTLQAAYLCALFIHMLTPSRTGKAHKMRLRWLPVSSHYNPIKVD